MSLVRPLCAHKNKVIWPEKALKVMETPVKKMRKGGNKVKLKVK